MSPLEGSTSRSTPNESPFLGTEWTNFAVFSEHNGAPELSTTAKQ